MHQQQADGSHATRHFPFLLSENGIWYFAIFSQVVAQDFIPPHLRGVSVSARSRIALVTSAESVAHSARELRNIWRNRAQTHDGGLR